MGAYLIDHPPRVSQFGERTSWRPSRPTGLIVLHTAESVMDTVGPDTGAESVAEFIRNRTTYGSYHTLCDSDSRINLVPFHLGAYQDGTGSNGMALSISFACSTSDWARMSPEKRKGFLRQGALAFADMQAWLKSNGYPTTPLRLVSKAESDAGAAGLIYHGHRDPARRSDPGVRVPNLFPLAEFIAEVKAAMSGTPAPAPDTMEDEVLIVTIRQTPHLLDGPRYQPINAEFRDALKKAGVREVVLSDPGDETHKALFSFGR